ncbi:glycine betaine ABC transporter substrate-binding protein [Streptomyces sp. NBC_00124]|uniref:glycine betaine ABC transporter substrate-binding protein n=1 Tax=Streptomyces sp. NBC_00124 TaxID=2975662 RepID=UPI002255678C|nr:glycine betaine ABC transporter substrate-binding protein [Streptomyces sp. NBC_00124]MCX5367114.1 glycine betaine ABC transporter substrate-binding protein [Streptomyces sp. NBC_00124]
MRLGIAVSVLALAAAGCAESSGASGDDKTITMGVIPGWTDETSTAYLLKNVLEKNGYTVKITSLSDNAPMYTALANGDIDLLSSAWPERTHKSYMDKYGDKIEDVGTYYDHAGLFLAVPTYSDVKSIADLPSHAKEFDGKVTGIEPGAGLTKATQDDVFPAYGLDGKFKLVTSSTTAMLTELKKATGAKKPIVVTLWKPFWANQAFPVRPLEDPKGAFGKPEGLHSLARDGFAKDFPDVANMIKNFKLSDAQYGSLEDSVVNKFGQGKEPQAVQAWLKENPDYAPSLEKYLKK